MDIKQVIENYTNKGYHVTYFETGAEAAAYLNQQIDHTTVGFGGSMTLKQLGLDLSLAEHNQVYNHWRVPEGMTAKQVRDLEMTAQVYLTSVNGASETGDMVNIDGTGNRVSAMLYGHKKTYFVMGKNKLVPTLEDAVYRARNIAAPLNAKRLGRKTPCAEGGRCFDCSSPERICSGAAIMCRPMGGVNLEIILIGEDLGY
ncbi:MAG: lactate utilization protein [Firmicutes bacterium]|nr:lactate utilization protein [Bacillota bacterium]